MLNVVFFGCRFSTPLQRESPRARASYQVHPRTDSFSHRAKPLQRLLRHRRQPLMDGGSAKCPGTGQGRVARYVSVVWWRRQRGEAFLGGLVPSSLAKTRSRGTVFVPCWAAKPYQWSFPKQRRRGKRHSDTQYSQCSKSLYVCAPACVYQLPAYLVCVGLRHVVDDLLGE